MPVLEIIGNWPEIAEQITAKEINVGEFTKISPIIIAECGVMRIGRVIV